jgi:CheY-like chemotaxis protein
VAEILVIDDMPSVRRAVDSMLRHAGHNVTAATDSAEGLEILTQRHFDLVIIDILRPKLDGSEVIFQLSTLPNPPPLLAISGGGAGSSARDALQSARLRADGFRENPFDKDQFMTLVAKLLGKKTCQSGIQPI